MKSSLITILACAVLAGSLAAQSDVTVANFSTRGLVGEGDDVMILGISIAGNPDNYRPVLLRGTGPLLADYGITNFITDPRIAIYAGPDLIASNDNWQTGGQRYAIAATGYAPADANEGAFIALLTPGNYTMHLGSNAGPGNGLAEAYFIDEKNLPTNLIAAGSFQTLVAAVQAAGLLDTLVGPGPFTLFAPTDEAFAALPAGTVEALLADIPTLTNILLYHVVAGAEVRASQINAGPVLMANGAPASLTLENGVQINGANVIEADWLGTNGVIHVIDQVILPPADQTAQTVVQNLVAQGNFSTLVAAVVAAGLVDTLNSAGPFTVFAPTDAAFAALPAGTVDALLADVPTLTDILLYHVVSGAQVLSSQVTDGPVTMANGDTATLSTTGGVKINAANVTGADWVSSNGVIHIIDQVILPPAP